MGTETRWMRHFLFSLEIKEALDYLSCVHLRQTPLNQRLSIRLTKQSLVRQ